MDDELGEGAERNFKDAFGADVFMGAQPEAAVRLGRP